MNINKYLSYFHDGSIISIEHKNDAVVIFMESSEVDPEETRIIPLTKRHTIKGSLHFDGVKRVLINGNSSDVKLSRFNDYEIMHFDLFEGTAIIELFSWEGGEGKSQDYSTVLIEAKQILWENNPNF